MNRRNLLGLLGSALLAPFVPLPPAEIVADVAAGTTTLTSFGGLLRERYADGTVKQLNYASAPAFFSLIPKREALE